MTLHVLLQIFFITLVVCIYILGFFLLWSGFYPETTISEFITKYDCFLPWFVALVMPGICIVFFLINRDPKAVFWSTFRSACVRLMTHSTYLKVASLTAVVIAVVVLGLLVYVLYWKDSNKLAEFLDEKYEESVKQYSTHAHECISLAARSAIEARKDAKTRENLLEVDDIAKGIEPHDKAAFMPVWCRSISNYCLGNINYCRSNPDECKSKFHRSQAIAGYWIKDSKWSRLIARSEAQALLSLAETNKREDVQKDLRSRMWELANGEFRNDPLFIFIQGECHFHDGDYSAACRCWKKLVDKKTLKDVDVLDGVVSVSKIRNRIIDAEKMQGVGGAQAPAAPLSSTNKDQLRKIAQKMRTDFEHANNDWLRSRTSKWRLKEKYLDSLRQSLDEVQDTCGTFDQFLEYCRLHPNEAFAIPLADKYRTLDYREKQALGFYLFRTLFNLEKDHRTKDNELRKELAKSKDKLSSRERREMTEDANAEGNLASYLRTRAIGIFKENIHLWMKDRTRCASAYGANFCDVLFYTQEPEYKDCLFSYCEELRDAKNRGFPETCALADDCPVIFETARKKASEVLASAKQKMSSPDEVEKLSKEIIQIELISQKTNRKSAYISNPDSACSDP